MQNAALQITLLFVLTLLAGCSKPATEDPLPANPGGRLVSKTNLFYNQTDYYTYDNQRIKSIERKDDKTGASLFIQSVTYSATGKILSIVRKLPTKTVTDYSAEYDAADRLVKEKQSPDPESVAEVNSYSYTSAGVATRSEYHLEYPNAPRPTVPTYYVAEFNADKTVSKIYQQNADGTTGGLWLSFFYENTYNPFYSLSLPVSYTYPHINSFFIPVRNLAKVTRPYETGGKTEESTQECIYEYDSKKRIISAVVSSYTAGTQPRNGTKYLFRYED